MPAVPKKIVDELRAGIKPYIEEKAYIRPSKLKFDFRAFRLGQEWPIVFVDLSEKKYPHWQNNGDTVVFHLADFCPTGKELARMLQAVCTDRPDEFHTLEIGEKTIIRMWWD